MKELFDWLDNRTGCRKLLREALFENVPGGSRWRYVWGSTLTFTLGIQFITGIFLWMAYNPSSQTAWESVYYIQHEMTGGWFLRGLHHFTAQAMNILLVLHLMQVVVDGAYKAPREVNFWFGIGLLFLVMGLSLTGYLLPWDQKGYWATKVATSIAAITPFIGPEVQKLIIGGSEYGHHTLSRFFALHAGVLPGSIVLLLVGHIYLFRRHGLTAKEPKRKPDEAFWPDQVLKDAVACLAVLATVLFLVLRSHGAPLGAPADPSEPYSAARPEWYFLFLFQLLKYFPGESEIWGAMVIPSVLMILVLLMPFFGRWRMGHRFNLGLLWVLLAGTGLLTWLALSDDGKNPDYLAAVQQAEQDAHRIQVLARGPGGIPAEGAAALLREDALTMGPRLFAEYCASCHRYDGHDGTGRPVAEPQSASDLKGFGSRVWLQGLLDPQRVASTNYFGGTKFASGKMVRFVQKDVAGFSAAEKEQLAKVLLAISAEASLKSQRSQDTQEAAAIAQGRTLADSEVMRCTECHEYLKENEDASAPVLTGYGSRDWLVAMISNPGHARFYGTKNDRMPAFQDKQVLNAKQIGLIADWLRGEWYEADSPSSSNP